MASSSQRVSTSLSSTEPSAPRWKYDVFLSFRGKETRKGIAIELYDALNREGIKTFMDDQDLPVGATISPSLLKAIEESRFAIIVLSPNYASSSWCLEELTKIVDCMKDDDRVLPLFYHVEPTNVRYQKRSFAEAFTEHEAKSWHATEKLKKWRDALEIVANFSGWDTENYKTERELVEVIVKSVCNKVGRQVADIAKNLQTEVDKLSVAKATVDEKVTAAEAKGEKIHANVQNWLNKVDDITKKAEEFLKDEIQATVETNDSLSHPSEKSLELLQEVTKLYETREFSDVSYVGRTEDACLASPDEHYEKFDSRVSTLEKIMKELASSSTDMILVYGIGGVGKTTLAEQVLRQAQKQRLFDDAVMVRDVKIPNLEAIQNQIADKLGLNILNIQTVPGRADKVNERIKDKKSLVILDDVWGEIDLKAVGLPHIPTCRILLTSRSQQVFSINIKQKEFPLGVLDEKEAWILFKKKAGDVVADPAIQIVATQVAQKCGGLPVLVITVARALENKTLPIWKNALKSLKKFDERGNLTHKAYLGIEWSYRQLNDQELLQPLFLLCGTTVQGNYISLTNLLRYSIGLGFFEDHTVEEARNALYAQVDKLKSSCLLLEGDDNTCVRMHDLVHDVAKRIARRDQHVLVEDEDVEDGGPELKKWPNKDFFNECTKISLPCCNIATLPKVPWECPKLEMFHLRSKDVIFSWDKVSNFLCEMSGKFSEEKPSNFFEEMKNLKVLGLNNLPPISLPPSPQRLKNLQTLCLDGCMFEDIAQVGELRKLQILSIVKSKVKQLPKEIGQLTSLRLLDLSDCDRLEVISPGVISNLTSLEDLRMRNSFVNWQGTKRVLRETSNNASLSELKKLSKLTALEIRIPDANILPPDLFSDKLERYQIFVGFWTEWDRDHMSETTLNTLTLQFTARNELDRGLKMMLEKCDVLSLDGRMGFDFSYIINTNEVMSNLTTLSVNNCGDLKYLLSPSSMARNLKKLKISECEIMEEIVSTREHDEEDYMFDELKSLKLESLPNLARFCTGKCIEFPLLEKLDIEDCPKLEAFVGGPMTKSSRKGEIGERDSEENCDVHSETTFVFDEKVKFPKLEILHFEKSRLQTIWHNQLAPGSFCRLRKVYLHECENLRSIFPPSMMGRLNALETLTIYRCESVEVIFDERGETNVNETHGTSSTRLQDSQNLISVHIFGCGSLKNIFPASMATGCLQQLQELDVVGCREMESIVAKEEGGLELTTPHPKFVFPKVKSLKFHDLSRLRSFCPRLHTSKWPSLKKLEVGFCDEVEFLAAELSIFQERHPHAPTKQPLFLIDQDSFPVLEEMRVGTTEILYGQSPAESIFSKLKSIDFTRCAPFSKGIFVDERNSNGEIHAVGSLPSVTNLNFSGMDNLMHLGKEKCSQPVFPNLEFLRVSCCDRLKNLESSAISFQNLTALEVFACDGLKCLIPYSIAKCLVHLTKMKVTTCKSIVVIVASNGDDDAGKNEIAFSQLQHLTLEFLPRLQGFSSGNCIAKLPLSLILDVTYCPIKLKISTDGVPIPERLQITEEDEDDDTASVFHQLTYIL